MAISKFKQTSPQYILSALLCLFLLCYSTIYFYNTYPLSEGWNINYAELVLNGKVPYRDFYYYLPPLNILIDIIFEKLSFGFLLGYRAWRLAERAVLWVLLFQMLCRFFDKYKAFAACCLSVVLCTADVYDLFGDYNQTMALLSVVLPYFVFAYLDASDRKKKLYALAKAGVILGLMFLSKQTVFLANGICYFIALSYTCCKKKDKDFLWYCGAVILGAAIPILIAVLYLLANGALSPFVEQVFLDTSGKGGLTDILFTRVLGRLANINIWMLLCCMLAPIICGIVAEKLSLRRAVSATASLCLLGLGLSWFLGVYAAEWELVTDALSENLYITAILLLASVSCAVLIVTADFNKRARKLTGGGGWISATIAFCVLLPLIGLTADGFCNSLYDLKDHPQLFTTVTSLVTVAAFYISILCMIYYGFSLVKDAQKEKLFYLSIAAIGLVYAGLMADGGSDSTINAFVSRISVPLSLCVVFSFPLGEKGALRTVKGGVFAVCAVLSLGVAAQKNICAYSWWGCEEEPRKDKVYTTDISALAGVRFSEKQAQFYETITALVEENTDEDAVIWGYPYAKIFNVITKRYSMETFVPVLFYDVVADSYVTQEAEMLTQHLPDVVIWQDIPGCKETHEEVYRNGKKLEQREIEAMFDEILPLKYEKLWEMEDVAVYKLKEEAAQESISFAGKGTAEEPYLIQTAEDLQQLSNFVNEGVTFQGKYFKQTADLDLAGCIFTPIGEYSSEGDAFFYGIYDGAGHVIRNLTIESDSGENVGLFGRLGGEVYNLGLENEVLYGGCVGGISSHSAGDSAKIINCYTNATIKASRAGGIADNFSGTIENGLSVGSMEGIQNADVISYNNTLNVKNVFSVQENFTSIYHEQALSDERIIDCDEETINSDFVVSELNAYVASQNKAKSEETNVADSEDDEKDDTCWIQLIPWKIGDEGHPIFDLSQQ